MAFMTKDIDLLAMAIRQAGNNLSPLDNGEAAAIGEVCNEIAIVLYASNNPNFDRTRFIQKAGCTVDPNGNVVASF